MVSMKKVLIVPLLGIFLMACSSGPSAEGPETDADQSAQEQVDQQSTETGAPVISAPILLTEDEFAEKIFDFRAGGAWKYKGDKPCMVDFYADWCAPCRIIAPYMNEIARDFSGKMYVYKVDTDRARQLSTYFQIKGIPSVMFCPMDGNYQMHVGAFPKEEYIRLIKSTLNVSL
jgi:thioredoxin 1